MTCPACGSQAVVKTRLGRVSCSTCGTILVGMKRCPKCGHEISVLNDELCGRCAAKVVK